MILLMGIFIGIFIFYLKMQRNIDLLYPNYLFTLVISTTYFISLLQLSGRQSEYPIWFVIFIITLICAFSLGGEFGKSVKFSLRNKRKKLIEVKSEDKYDSTIMRLICTGTLVAILFSFIIEIMHLGLPPAISGVERKEYFLSGWGSIVGIQSALFGVLLYDHYHEKAMGKLFFLYSAIILIIAFLLANKYQIIYMVLLYLIAKNYFKKKIEWETFIKLFFVVILVFEVLNVAVYSFMYNNFEISAMREIYQIYLPEILNPLIYPYMYVAFNYENLYLYLISDHSYFWGISTFQGLISMVGLDSFFQEELLDIQMDSYYHLNIASMTTSTMFSSFLQDGGIFFSYIMTFLLGEWSYIAYRNFQDKINFFSFYMFSTIVCSIFLSFFYNGFLSKITLVNLLAAYFISFLLKHFSFSRNVSN